MRSFESWLQGLIAQESGGNYNARNERTGAYGKFQIMPENWPAWSKEILGFEGDPTNPEHQELVARGKLKQYYDEYGEEGALVAWYAGETNGARWRDGAPYALGQDGPYSWDAKQGAGDEPSVREYVQQALGKGSYSLAGAFDRTTDPFGARAPVVPTVEPMKINWWTETKDKFNDAFFDSPVGGAARRLWSGLSAPNEYQSGIRTLTQEDVDYVTKNLPGDYVAQKYVLINAKNPAHLAQLVAMKQEDIARRARVENYSMGLSSIGTIAGTLADPLNFLPIGQEAVVMKTLARLGKVGTTLSLSKIARYSELAVTNGALNVAGRYGAEQLSGYQQDYTAAALVGGVAGVGLDMAKNLLRRGAANNGILKVFGALDNAESHAIAQTTGIRLPNEIPTHTKGELKTLHDTGFTHASANFQKLVNRDSLFVVAKNDLQKAANRLGMDIPDNAKAFYNPAENYTVLVKDNLKAGDNLNNILALEVGVQHGLKNILGDKTYHAIMATVRKQLTNPQGAWKAAIEAAPNGRLEQILGHFIDNTKADDKIFSRLRTSVNNGLRKLGLTADLSDAQTKDFLKKALQTEVQKSQGYQLLSDGTAVINGLKYSADNLFHPNRLAEAFDIDTKASTPSTLPFEKLSQGIESGKFFGTIGGVLRNSKSNLMRNLAPTLFHDARMGEYTGALAMPVEMNKAHIKNQLNVHWGSYMDIRSQYIIDTITDGINPIAKALNFNRQVFECFNATYANNRNGLTEMNWPAAVKQAAQVIKNLLDDSNRMAQQSAQLLGTKSRNLIDAVGKAGDQELWRVLDEGSWLNFTNKFPTLDHSIKFLTDYAEHSAKRANIEQKLLSQKVKHWDEVTKPKWEKKILEYQQKRSQWEDNVAKIAARDEKRYQKLLDAWGEKVETWQDTVAALAPGVKRPPYPKKPARPLPSAKPRKPQEPPPPPEKPTQISPEELTAHINQEAEKWAKEITGLDHSNLEHRTKNGATSTPAFIPEQFPMDTTTPVQTPWGEIFSFDAQLRDDDLDRLVPKAIDRFAGETALRSVFSSAEHLDTVRAKFENELSQAVAKQQLTAAEKARELTAFDDGIARIRGTYTPKNSKNLWDAFTRMFTSLSHAQNGANAGLNQFGSVGGAIAYNGGRAIFHLLPKVADFVNGLKYGDDIAKAIKEAELKAFGDTLESRIWQNTSHIQSRIFKEATAADSTFRFFDKINTGINYASKLTSQLSLLPGLTDRMLRGARTDTIMDTIEWANGKEFSNLRNPFSQKKLKAAGISPDIAAAIKQHIKTYLYDGQGNLKPDIDKWLAENPGTFYKWKFLIDNQGLRSITQSTIGNTNILKEANPFTRMMFQSKDLAFKAVNAQTLRALSSREIDDALAALYSMGTSMMVYAGLTAGRAYAYWPDDKDKRDAYLQKRLAPEELAMAALLGGVITGSALGFGRDLYEMATGGQSTNPPVNPTAQAGKNPQARPLSDTVGNAVTQLPVVRAAKSVVYDTPHVAYKALAHEQITKQDLRDLARALPLQSWLPSVFLTGQLINKSDFPESPTKTSPGDL